MAIRAAITHTTEYTYERPVTMLPQVVRLRPAPHCRTPIVSYSLKIEPAGHFLNWQQDPYSNYLARLVFPKETRQFQVTVDLVAELVTINPFDFFLDNEAQRFPFPYEASLAGELTPFLETETRGPLMYELVEKMRRHEVRTIDYLVELNRFLQQHIRYLIRMEPGIQSTEETLTKKSGSCRDSAWLLVQMLRHLGLASRFVSGYLIQLTPDVAPLEGPKGPTKDFTDLHAWAEVYLPGAGWIGLDPTSGLLAGEGHIPLACTAKPQDAAPITGSYLFAKDDTKEEDTWSADFRFDMSVVRVDEKPRVTKPYSEEQWLQIDRLGTRLDAELKEHDVRLTMGGEPTFVSMDDKDGDEWNTTAVGPTKRHFADKLLRRLRARFSPGGFLHHGQGKWYPGESLPRWAFACYWRKDGQPVWQDPTLIADDERDYGFTSNDAKQFMLRLTERLQVDAQHVLPAYEDAWYYLWRERRLPTNVDPLDSKLDDPEERARLARIFEKGLNSIAGYAIPLKYDRSAFAGRWVSGNWFLRQEHLFLLPGDSSMGYRLPLDSLPWIDPEKRHRVFEPCPLRPPISLDDLPARIQGRTAHHTTGPSDDSVVRTALCVELRRGRLHVFMPPLSEIPEYLELVSHIESTARELALPVQMEGYSPPSDPRLLHFKVTPDPGVLEVNIHPAASWNHLVENTHTLYEEAHRLRLCTEKFMIDGRHTGTGGGNHVILGGPTPADSPLLRRPDLLRSLVSYWHNHPSLSYLFSGLFVGPTSQAPRVDEARNDALYELELAFEQIPEKGTIQPWLVDRLFRHLLVDSTGNTHRAEFCIDKLYSPDSSAGRLGLLEFRAFEMPPHERMSLVQLLLIRGLTSYFWKRPYKQHLARWGTELHDRFMLPHFVWADFRDVLHELRRGGYPMEETWFTPHYEFRFPILGTLARDNICLELRTAIEPWHVLGEEGGAGNTVRCVDSSVERLQIKVQGLVDARHVLTCNGHRVPLYPTGVNGEFVAGVRYRAWQPPSCLHPTIPVNTPLVFDLFDTWLQRPVAGCTYYVAHPGGRSYETFPVNANEAESRRIARFFTHGHTPGAYSLPSEERRGETPHTLDLRYYSKGAAVAGDTREREEQGVEMDNHTESLRANRTLAMNAVE